MEDYKYIIADGDYFLQKGSCKMEKNDLIMLLISMYIFIRNKTDKYIKDMICHAKSDD